MNAVAEFLSDEQLPGNTSVRVDFATIPGHMEADNPTTLCSLAMSETVSCSLIAMGSEVRARSRGVVLTHQVTELGQTLGHNKVSNRYAIEIKAKPSQYLVELRGFEP